MLAKGRLVALLALAVVLPACGGGSPTKAYPPSSVSAFLLGCEKAGKEAGGG
jgi:hypothetical protein